MLSEKTPFILKCSGEHFTAVELQCLQEYGHQLQSIVTRHVPPMGRAEESFLKEATRMISSDPLNKALATAPGNGKFDVFLQYLVILAMEGKQLEINLRKTSPNDRQVLEGRARRGGLSTGDQENRYNH